MHIQKDHVYYGISAALFMACYANSQAGSGLTGWDLPAVYTLKKYVLGN